jgi:hypothetical protein
VDEASHRPSRLNATLQTGAPCPLKGNFSRPVDAFQIFTLLSALAEASHCPSGL